MEITLENIEHKKYGSVKIFVFELPLFLPTGKLIVPPLLSNKTLIDSFLNKQLSEVRELREEEDDETILRKLYSRLMNIAFMEDYFSPETPEFQFIFKLDCGSAAGQCTDEITQIGEDLDIEIGYKQFVKRLPVIEKFIENQGSSAEIEGLKHILPFPEAGNLLVYANQAARQAEKDIPDLWVKLGESHRESIKAAAAMVLTLDTDDYAEETMEEIQAVSTSPLATLEVTAGLRNLKIDSRIKDSYLFQRVLNRYAHALRSLFTIINLEDDVENGRDRYNGILRRAKSIEKFNGFKSPLTSSLEARIVDLKSILRDMKVLITKLEKTYPIDENVGEYLEIIQKGWDAQLLMILHSPEFEYLKPKLVISSP